MSSTEQLRFDQQQGRITLDRDVECIAEVIVGAWDRLQLQWLFNPTRDMESAMRDVFQTLMPGAPMQDPN